jgi:hypothetical protein
MYSSPAGARPVLQDSGAAQNGAAAFTSTKTAGACTFTISGGIITSVTGC